MYTTMITTLFFFITLTSVILPLTGSLPSGAPSCEVGKAAPMSLHLAASRNPTTGTLLSANFIVKIDGVVLDPDATNEIQANRELEVVITSDTGQQAFKGALMIVSKSALLTTDIFTLSTAQATDLQLNALCPNEGRSGVTHVDNNVKTSIAATMQFDENIDDLKFDVNVVVQNNDAGSFFYWTQYTLKVVGATAPPTAAPRSRGCGLFGFNLFCPFTLCGLFGRLIFGDDFC
jgi:Reeler domain